MKNKKIEKCERWYGTFHDWSKWEVIVYGDIKSTIHKGIIGKFLHQQRECKVCGYKQLEETETK